MSSIVQSGDKKTTPIQINESKSSFDSDREPSVARSKHNLSAIEPEIRANSPVSSLALVLQDVNLERTQSSHITSKTEPEPLFNQHRNSDTSVIQPVPVRRQTSSLFSPEHSSSCIPSNKASQLPRRLFDKSPPHANLDKSSSTPIRRTQSDFGIGRIRKSLTFDGEEDSREPLRNYKRPMHQSNVTAVQSKRNDEPLITTTTTTTVASELPQFCIHFPPDMQQAKENVPPTPDPARGTRSQSQSIASIFSPLPPSPNTSRRRRSFACGSTSQERLLPQALKNNLQIDLTSSNVPAEPDRNDQVSEDTGAPLVLPICETHQSLPFISCATMANILRGELVTDSGHIIVDCRYEYEFQGGHIKGAVNMKTPTEVENEYFCTPQSHDGRLIIIFHCEFSSHRGPTLCKHLRNRDRQLNLDNYPTLYYPQLYVLKGGFKEFYEQYPQLCEPSGYVPMLDPRYKDELKRTKLELRAASDTKVKRSFSTPDLTFKRNDTFFEKKM